MEKTGNKIEADKLNKELHKMISFYPEISINHSNKP